jgi:hypothetical protein
MVLDSESVLVSTNMLVPEESSLGSHSRSDLESSSVLEWLSWPLNGSLIDPPSLVETIVAFVEDGVHVVGVSVSIDIKAESSVVLDVLVMSIVPSDLIEVLSSVWSDDGSGSTVEVASDLLSNNV